MGPWLKGSCSDNCGAVESGPTSRHKLFGWQTLMALEAQTDRWKVQA